MDNKVLVANRAAKRDYHILETFEVGIVLKGYEVKSLRDGKATINDSFARVEKGELFLYNLYIPPYSHVSQQDLDPTRVRKLLAHRAQIERFLGQIEAKGKTLVALKIYFKDGHAKVELALAKGKRPQDKRETIKKREHDREVQREIRGSI